MQETSLQNFKRDIGSIREYIKHISLINEIGLNNRYSTEKSLKEFSRHLHGFSTDKKLFEYKAIVISLYGVLEKHIGIWIQEHIDTIPSLIPSYDKLNETSMLHLLQELKKHQLLETNICDELGNAYKAYRTKQHHLALQLQSARVDISEFNYHREKVIHWWQHFFSKCCN